MTTHTTAQPTPGPWILMPGELAISGQDPEKTRYQEIARMVNGNTTCTHLHVSADEMGANAAHIVHCVNTYPTLVEALEHALDSLQNSVQANEGGIAREINLDTVRKALALARKEASCTSK